MLGSPELASAALSPFMTPRSKPAKKHLPDEALRLRQLREALDFPTANSFAAFLDISTTRYNNIENGTPLSRDVVFRLVQRVPGLTSDWLYFGRPEGMPFELARRLGLLEAPGKRTTA